MSLLVYLVAFGFVRLFAHVRCFFLFLCRHGGFVAFHVDMSVCEFVVQMDGLGVCGCRVVAIRRGAGNLIKQRFAGAMRAKRGTNQWFQRGNRHGANGVSGADGCMAVTARWGAGNVIKTLVCKRDAHDTLYTMVPERPLKPACCQYSWYRRRWLQGGNRQVGRGQRYKTQGFASTMRTTRYKEQWLRSVSCQSAGEL